MQRIRLAAHLGGIVAFALVVGLGGGRASASPILTFGFTELDGNFDGTSLFAANVASDTDGDVTRMLPSAHTAWYHADFTNTAASYDLAMTLTNLSATTADGAGSCIITDVDGDTITANLTGTWMKNGPFAFFNGLLDHVYFNQNGNGSFDGPSGGSFSMDFSAYGTAPYDGAIMTLETGQWFVSGTPWQDQSTLVQGSVLPEPSSLGLLGLGMLGAWRRRRR